MQVDGFLRRLIMTGVRDVVNATTLVTVDKPGLPGFDAFINGCKPSDIPIINQVLWHREYLQLSLLGLNHNLLCMQQGI